MAGGGDTKTAVPKEKGPEKRTWVEKVTDDTNHWLSARSLEKDELYERAAYHYLKDACEQRSENILRTALSAFCAGRCLALTGDIRAASLFLAAGRLYESAFDSVPGSGSEADWLLERISYCRSKASDLGNGKHTAKAFSEWFS
ncbi:MAG: hypothetical protein ACE5QW_07825 [Thermoplasmata archaeon]